MEQLFQLVAQSILAHPCFSSFSQNMNLSARKYRVFSAFNMVAGREKILARSRSHDQICPSRMYKYKYAIFFKMAARNKVREIWVRQLPRNKMEFDVRKPNIRMDESTSNENAVDDREILLFFSFHVILNQCKFIYGYYFSGL